MHIRSFLAFDIPEKMKEELSSIISLLSGKVKDMKWTELDLMHCTLRFFGEVEEELVMGRLSEVIEREVRHQAPMKLLGRGIGVFPNWRYPKVIWAGLHGETESIISLHAKLEEAFEDFRFQKDKRQLRLHLTLGRTKGRFKEAKQLMQVVEKMTERAFGEVNVDSLTLYKSELTKDGPVYTVLKKFPLGGKR